MTVVESSLSYRAALHATLWLESAGRCSLVGKFLIALARVVARVCADSGALGLQRTGSRRLEWNGHPWSVLLISRPYLRVRSLADRLARGHGVAGGADAIGGGAGIAADAGAVRHVVIAGRAGLLLGGGMWLPVVGAGIFALGCGRVAFVITHGGAAMLEAGISAAPTGLQLIGPVILAALGALIFVAGPFLTLAASNSLVVRGARRFGRSVVEGRSQTSSPEAGVVAASRATETGAGSTAGRTSSLAVLRRSNALAWLAVLLASAAGAAGGLTQGWGPAMLVALVAALCVLVLIFWRPEVLLLAVAVFPWLDWAARRTLGGFGPAWDDGLLALSIVVLLWCVLLVRRSELWTVPILLPALLALAAAVGSVMVNHVPGDVALFALRVLFQPLLLYFLGFLFPKSRRWVQWVVAAFILAGVAAALHGLFQYMMHAPMPARWVDVREVDIGTRAYSIIENPNGLGAFLLMGIMISLSLALKPGLWRVHRYVMAVACVVQLAGVAVTFSRGAWLGLAAGVIALLIMSYRRYLIPLVVAGVIGWLVVPAKFTNRLAFAFSSTYIAKSMVAGRLYVWKMSLQHIGAHPLLGLGLGTFGGTTAVTFGYGRLWVDNFYLQLGAEGGLILLALFLWILLRAAKGLVKSHATTRDPYLRALVSGVFGGFIAVAVANVTASVWETLVVGVAFWFLTGFATSAGLHLPESEVVGDEAGAAAGTKPAAAEEQAA